MNTSDIDFPVHLWSIKFHVRFVIVKEVCRCCSSVRSEPPPSECTAHINDEIMELKHFSILCDGSVSAKVKVRNPFDSL